MSLMDALGGVGYALDTPGALIRGLLAGKPGHRATGREMLGIPDNQPGLDTGDVMGFGAEVITDPLTWLGLPLASKGLRALSGATKAAAHAKAASAMRGAPRGVGTTVARLMRGPTTKKTHYGGHGWFTDPVMPGGPVEPSVGPWTRIPAGHLPGPAARPRTPAGYLPAPGPSPAAGPILSNASQRIFGNTPVRFVEQPPGGRAVLDLQAMAGANPVAALEVTRDLPFQDAARRMYKLDPSEQVHRLQGIGLLEPPFGQGGHLANTGLGRELWRRAFDKTRGGWLGNSQLGYEDDMRAVASLQKLADAGRIELRWAHRPGGHFIARLTPKGERWVRGEIPNAMNKAHVNLASVEPDYIKHTGATLRDVYSPDDVFESLSRLRRDRPFYPTGFQIGDQRYALPEDVWKELFGEAGRFSDRFAGATDNLFTRGGRALSVAEQEELIKRELMPLLKQKMTPGWEHLSHDALHTGPLSTNPPVFNTDLAQMMFEAGSPLPPALVQRVRHDSFREGVDWLARDYLTKLRQSGGKQIINPHSGVKLFAHPKEGIQDLQDLLQGNYKFGEAMGQTSAGSYRPGLIRPKGGEWQIRRSWDPKTNMLRVVRPLPRGMSIARYNLADTLNKQYTGAHEGMHWLTDARAYNLHPSAIRLIQRVNEAMARMWKRRTGHTLPAETPTYHAMGRGVRKYYTKPWEVMSYLAEMRKALEDLGLQRFSSAPQRLPRVTSTLPALARGGSYAPYLNETNLITNPNARTAVQSMNDVYGRHLLNFLLRTLPAVPLAGAGLAYGMGQQQEA